MMANQRILLTVTQITATDDQLYGLDRNGRVWKYKPADKNGKAFCTQLTDFASKWFSAKGKEAMKLVW